MNLWVADTSPLIFLAKLDRLELLRRAADEILVPQAVIQEVREYKDEACRARLKGELPSLRAEIERLEKGGFRVGEPLRKAVLEAAGE